MQKRQRANILLVRSQASLVKINENYYITETTPKYSSLSDLAGSFETMPGSILKEY